MPIQQILIFLPAALLIAITPGANNLLCFRNSARWGLIPATGAVAGRCFAYALMIALVVAGLGQILTTSELLFQIIKWAGVFYLAWIGVSMLRNPGRESSSQRTNLDAVQTKKGIKGLLMGEFWVAITNPKAILLFSALLPQFVSPSVDTGYGMQMLILGLVYTLVEWCTATLYAALGRAAVAGHSGMSRMGMIQSFSGIMMLFIAGALALYKRADT